MVVVVVVGFFGGQGSFLGALRPFFSHSQFYDIMINTTIIDWFGVVMTVSSLILFFFSPRPE